MREYIISIPEGAKTVSIVAPSEVIDLLRMAVILFPERDNGVKINKIIVDDQPL